MKISRRHRRKLRSCILYALDCGDFVYCGRAVDVYSRLLEHAECIGANLTATYPPKELLYTIEVEFNSTPEANDLEKQWVCHIAHLTKRICSIGTETRSPEVDNSKLFASIWKHEPGELKEMLDSAIKARTSPLLGSFRRRYARPMKGLFEPAAPADWPLAAHLLSTMRMTVAELAAASQLPPDQA